MTGSSAARPIRLGTRGSALAVAQSGQVAEALRAASGRPVELVEVVTTGDRSAAPVQRLGVGVFVSALRDALAGGEIDVAVHSYKDLPTEPAPGLVIAAVPERADPRDVLVAADGVGLAKLPAGARVGTGAPRRMAQLNALGAGLTCVPIRGNVDTRIRKVESGELDAVVVAAAGLQRLGRLTEVTEFLDPDLVLPAPAQGALAVECRVTDTELAATVGALDDPDTRAAVLAERTLLATLEAGCTAPVGGYATVTDGVLSLRGAVVALDGSASIRRLGTGTPADAESVGRRLAAELLDAGADSLLESAR
ncbi:porphobilinogen deaminase [Actinocatenispora thailandica]|uniref:Porphobilinogen deaminase n=1 Tax=Actinocatenispora thailandica TaxID=227318 RepID=A0A7R7DUP1_9ACTN|nr:hydroxymethylbilane synthase [Actinocatenispora thailandica]BCJ38189.1 porphobilinogen deaminase [Actinocatenispora thailandica]